MSIFFLTTITLVSCKQKPKETLQNKIIVVEPKCIANNVSTDGNNLSLKPKPIQSRLQIVTEILTTSPCYQQLTKGMNNAIRKNGGQSFGLELEGSPFPKEDKADAFSQTYDFLVYENYPNRQLNSNRFTFNPENKRLFEYDPVLDEQKPIAFNKKLLHEYNMSNKE